MNNSPSRIKEKSKNPSDYKNHCDDVQNTVHNINFKFMLYLKPLKNNANETEANIH